MVSTLYLAKVLLTRPLPFVKYQLVVTFYFPNIQRLKETATERKPRWPIPVKLVQVQSVTYINYHIIMKY